MRNIPCSLQFSEVRQGLGSARRDTVNQGQKSSALEARPVLPQLAALPLFS